MRLALISAQKPTSIWVLVGWVVILTILLPGENGLQADVLKPLSHLVRQALTEHPIARTLHSSLQENRMTSAAVRAVVHDNLDPGLLPSVMETAGIDFRFIRSGRDSEAQVGVLILLFPDEKTVDSMTKKLANMGGYFKRTKILTPFSYAAVDSRLVIAFTENAGNEDLVEFIDEFPALFKAAP